MAAAGADSGCPELVRRLSLFADGLTWPLPMKALNVCSNPRPSPTAPGRRPGKRWTLLLPLGWLVLLLALRAVNTAHYRINSDEPQHLHVMWALGEGRMPYRDVFDNHMPLFGALFAPVVHA